MGLLERLVRLANALAEEDGTRMRSGELGDKGRIDYAVTVDSIRTDSAQRQQPSSASRREYLTDIREEDDELLVTVDVPDVSEDDLSVKFDDETGTVEIRDARRTVKRIDLPRTDVRVVAASYNNRVLELRFGGMENG
ncbi:Hsp20/alpha crystallin family protein [Haladaptatus salinisoli]|uniref:Hsp20/alpha crystallin family protein n=1 Tax=Haladaptatus salinisoli TaxID=2884876 RepID=UPI001D0B6855|nr:Hsp20/alpha crystallin family protein [Haladaptatus salinisoli]